MADADFLEIILVDGGTFYESSPNAVVFDSFYIGKYPITQNQWTDVMGTPSNNKNFSWHDAVEFCNQLSLQEGFEPCYFIDKKIEDSDNSSNENPLKWEVTCDFTKNGFRLPTEIEWAYVAGPYESGEKTPVDKLEDNAFGVCGIRRSIREWYWDWYGKYPSDYEIGSNGDTKGSSREIHGGIYNSGKSYRMLIRRYYCSLGYSPGHKFRVVRACSL